MLAPLNALDLPFQRDRVDYGASQEIDLVLPQT